MDDWKLKARTLVKLIKESDMFVLSIHSIPYNLIISLHEFIFLVRLHCMRRFEWKPGLRQLLLNPTLLLL